MSVASCVAARPASTRTASSGALFGASQPTATISRDCGGVRSADDAHRSGYASGSTRSGGPSGRIRRTVDAAASVLTTTDRAARSASASSVTPSSSSRDASSKLVVRSPGRSAPPIRSTCRIATDVLGRPALRTRGVGEPEVDTDERRLVQPEVRRRLPAPVRPWRRDAASCPTRRRRGRSPTACGTDRSTGPATVPTSAAIRRAASWSAQGFPTRRRTQRARGRRRATSANAARIRRRHRSPSPSR